MTFAQTNLDKKARGYDFWVGYQFSHWFAVEGAYLSMGKTKHNFSGAVDAGPVDVDDNGSVDYSGPQPLVGETTFRTRGPAVAAVGTLELGSYFSLDARGGLFFADNKLALRIKYSPESQAEQTNSYSESDGKTAFFYGASATFWITPYFGVRGGMNAFSKGSFDHSVKQYFVGIRYSYGL